MAQKEVATPEEEIKSLKTKLPEKEEIINKSGWKKWYLTACAAMGEIFRENTVNSSSPVTIKRDAFFERIKSNYPDQNEKVFGSANREAWKYVPDTVKHTDGSSYFSQTSPSFIQQQLRHPIQLGLYGLPFRHLLGEEAIESGAMVMFL